MFGRGGHGQTGSEDATAQAAARRGRSLRAYLVALIALCVVALGAGAVYVSAQADSSAREAVADDTSFAAQAASSEIGADLVQLQAAVARTASTPGLDQLLDARSTCTLSFGGAGVFSSGHLDIIRSDGSVACSSAPGPSHPGYAAAPWLAHALNGPTLVALFREPGSAAPVAVTAAPIPGRRGVVVSFVDLAPAAAGLTRTYGGATHLEFLVTSADSRTALTRSIDPQRWSGASLAGTQFATTSGRTDRSDVDGVPRLYGSATVAAVGWHIYAGEATATALAASNSLASHDIGIIIAAALVVIVALLIVYRRITRPISRLEARVSAARGGGSFDPIPVAGPSEIAGLASSFNTLMASVDSELTQRRRTEERLSESFAKLESVDAQRRRLLDKLITAQEEERRRIASDVHDDSIQVMTAAVMRISLIRQQDLDPKLDGQLAKLQDTSEKAIERLRHLLFQLCPPSLNHEGLSAALTEYLEQWTAEANLTYQVDNQLTFEPPLNLRAKLFRIAQEALTNVRKHAHASCVSVTLEQRSGGVVLRVVDDGVGMAATEFERAPIGHLGLVTMRERAELAGGWCHIDGTASSGTTVEVWVPVSNVLAVA